MKMDIQKLIIYLLKSTTITLMSILKRNVSWICIFLLTNYHNSKAVSFFMLSITNELCTFEIPLITDNLSTTKF